MANENMIQKHEDNFLAKIAGGATPVDTNVRNTTEFWLDKIADWIGGKSTDDASTKKIYCHPVQIVLQGGDILFCLIFNNDGTAFTKDSFKAWFNALKTAIGTVRIMVSGGITVDQDSKSYPASQLYADATYPLRVYGGATSLYKNYTAVDDFFNTVVMFTDNVNPIN